MLRVSKTVVSETVGEHDDSGHEEGLRLIFGPGTPLRSFRTPRNLTKSAYTARTAMPADTARILLIEFESWLVEAGSAAVEAAWAFRFLRNAVLIDRDKVHHSFVTVTTP
jgi:hypothetical protein